MRRLWLLVPLGIGVGLWLHEPALPQEIPSLPVDEHELLREPEDGLVVLNEAIDILDFDKARLDAMKEAVSTRGPPATRGTWLPHQAALDLAENVLAGPPLRIPVQSLYGTDPPPLPPTVQYVGRAFTLRGWDELADGHAVAAAEDMLRAAFLGARVQDGSGDVVDYGVGVSIEHGALRELGELLDVVSTPEVLRVAAAGLETLERPPRLAAIEAAACGAFVHDVQVMAQRAQSGADGMPATCLPESSSPLVQAVTSVFYDEGKTLRLIYQQCMISAATAAAPRPLRPTSLGVPWGPLDWLDNPVGRYCTATGFSADMMSTFRDREDTVRALRAVLTVLVAVRLDPERVPVVPDPFSREPIQVRDGRVWSVGERVMPKGRLSWPI